MLMLRLSLLLVVFVDVMGQGLILPIVNTLLIDPSSTFLPTGTPQGTRELLYGLLIGIFYVFWFFGAAYISKLSDYIGRKRGIEICLLGALVGYVLTVIAIEASNFYLLLLGRAISGFTAGNQPIAQAALVDISRTDEERTRNMGKVVAASALGLVAGPLIAGLLSDSAVMGRYATLELPFICATALVFLALVLVLFFYHDARTERRKIDFGLSEVFLNLWRVRRRPTILKISAVFFFAELGLNAFFIYLDDYTIERFQFDTFQNSILMTVFGLVMAFASGVLAGPLSARFRKIPLVAFAVALMAVSLTVFVFNGIPLLSYFLVVPIVFGFALAYPTMLALFSLSAGDDEQGWVMGVSIALFTLGSGIISFAGGAMMTIDARLPFITGIASFVIALIFIATLWRQGDVRALDQGGS
ncbi:MAG: MFS transporter [Alphaproteobacteria bacterium]|nr:MFS transporter [Alphaproteobacteria bacterium]